MFYCLFPSACLICRHPTRTKRDICQDCENELPLLSHACLRCASPLPPAAQQFTCGTCLAHSPPFARVYALYLYETPITTLILQLKFHHALVNARVLAASFAERILTDWYRDKPLPEVIIPVPLHVKRLRERGFNQAVEIARPLAKRLKIPLNLTGCQRIKATMPQAKQNIRERKKNMRGAFCVQAGFNGKHVVIVDDVMTTGHTITELSFALKRVGAKQIDIWCMARPTLLSSTS